jgi:hypothetical protein
MVARALTWCILFSLLEKGDMLPIARYQAIKYYAKYTLEG